MVNNGTNLNQNEKSNKLINIILTSFFVLKYLSAIFFQKFGFMTNFFLILIQPGAMQLPKFEFQKLEVVIIEVSFDSRPHSLPN